MSFFSISNPEERERVVQDYQRIMQEIRERGEKRKMTGQNRNRMLQETFHPVVKAQTDMAEKIVKSLKEINPIKQEKIPIQSKKRRLTSDNDEFGPLANAYRNRWMSRDNDIDTSFGINFYDGEPYIASTPIKIENDDIIIYNEVYESTPGLWTLITEKRKRALKENITSMIWLSMRASYVRQMFSIKIIIRIRPTQEVVLRGNGKMF